jgi:type II secretion system protein H
MCITGRDRYEGTQTRRHEGRSNASSMPPCIRPFVPSSRTGFTMVEIVVVLLIMAVVLTMTAVKLSSATAGVATRESAGGLLAALRYARYYSAIHGCECRITFSRANNSYELTARTDPDKDQFDPVPGLHRTKLDEQVRFAAIVIQPRDTESQIQDVITFQPTGEADAASIVLSDGRTSYSLVVTPNSGQVRLRNGAVTEIPNDREDLDARA